MSSARLEDVCVCVCEGGGVFSKPESCLKGVGVGSSARLKVVWGGVGGGLQQGWRREVLECVPLWRTFSVSVFICSTTHYLQNDSKCPKGFCSK